MSDDYASSTSTTGSVAVGGSATGEIETSGDRDWFAVTLEAGKTYLFDLEGSGTDAGTLSNPFLRGIHDAAGDLVAGTMNDNDGTGYNSRVGFTATEDATYYVSAGAHQYQSGGTGTYTLSVTEVADDFGAWTGTTGTVAVGSSTTGGIDCARDRDWFAVELEAGKTYQFDLEGSPTDAGTLSDPYLRGIHDADGNLISGTWNDDGGTGRNSRLEFTAQEAGTYYVTAAGFGDHEGTYTLSVREDFTAGTDTAGTVTVGGSATGEIELGGDRDWFAVELEAGKTYRIDLEGSRTDAGTLSDPYLRGIHDAAGNLIAGTANNNGGAGKNSQVTFTAQEAGTCYVAAGASGDREGTYKLSVTEVPDDFTAGIDTAGTVMVDGSTTGEIEFEGDRDWFAVELEAGKIYRFDLEGSPTDAGSLSNPYLRGIHDSDGDLIAGTTNDNGGTGNNSRMTFMATEDATYYVSAGANGSRTGTYTLSVTTEDTDDFTAGTDTAGTVTVGGSATGELEFGGDRDWFAVTLEVGKTYRFDLEGSPTSAGTLSDPYLRGLYDAAGDLIAGTTNDNGGTGKNSRVTFTATEDATYYVSAGASQSLAGTYKLSVEEVPDDFTAGTETSGAVTVGGSATGEIEFGGDRDWFAVTLEAGKTYLFDLEGSPTSAGTLSNPYLRGLYDAAGDLIAGTTNDDAGAGRNSRVTFTATEDATYYVSAGAYESLTGTYKLSVEEVPDDFTAGTDTAGKVTVGGLATGEIELVGDRDWFAVELEAGKTYRFDLEGSPTSAGTLSNPYLRGIHDAAGDLITGTTNDNGGTGNNSRVTFTAIEDATYYVSAGAFGTYEGTYTLSVTDLTDDFTAGADTAGTVTVGGSATGEIERGGDRDWFAVELEAGKTYWFDLEGSGTDAGTLSDPFLRGIHDAAGDLIAGTTNNDGGTGTNSRVTFTATEDATYYVSAGAYQSLAGTYTLSVEEVPDDFTAGTDTAGTVMVDGSTTGEIELTGDRDWFAVELEAGKIYRFDLEGSPTDAGSLSNPYLRGIHDADGNLIAGTTNDSGGTGNNSRVTFTATEDATYYVSAGANGSSTGTYTLSVTTEDTDDFTAGADTAGTVTVGGSATGEIDHGGDRDWFAVELEAGKIYEFGLKGSPTGKGTLSDPHLRGIHDADGDLIAGTGNNNGGVGNNSRVRFTATEDATYYVSAGAYQSHTGTYTLSVKEIPDDFTAGTDTAGTVTVDGSAAGEIDYVGDIDWFAVELEARKTYWVDLDHTGNTSDPYLRLHGIHDAAGDLIAGTADDDGGGLGHNSRVTFRATEDATYYVAAGTGRSLTGTYALSVTEVPDDFTAWTDTTGTVRVGRSATGEIEIGGDRDWFAVELEAGKTYQFNMEGLPTSAGTMSNPHLRGIYDADGNRIAGTGNDNGGTGLNSRVEFTATEDATYYVSAGAFHRPDTLPPEFIVTGSYTLSVRDVTDETPDRAGTVTVGGSATGEIEERSDRDWFAVELEAGQSYRFDLEGSHTSAGTLSDPYLYGIHDADGNLISGTTNDDGGTSNNARVKFTATKDATYYVSAGAYESLTGTYKLSVREIPDDFTVGTETSGTVTVDGSATGKIERGGDRDWFAVELEAGKTYWFDLEGSRTSAGTLSNPYLRGIHDADGNLIAGTTNNDGGTGTNSRVEFTATEDATYYVSAGANGSRTGTYTLSVTEDTDDFTAGVDTAGSVTVDGTVTGEIEIGGDRDWFAVELEAGKSYWFALEGSRTSAGTLSDPYLRGIHDADGDLIAGTTNNNGGDGKNSRVTFTVTEDGTYYVSAGAYGSIRTGTYTLSVTEVTDDFTAGTDTAGTVAVGGSATGEIELRDDRDWFAVELEAGKTYRFDLEGSRTSAGSLSDPYLRGIHDAAGDLITGTADDESGTGHNSRVEFTATEDATYYVSAGAYQSHRGTYTLSVEEVPDDFTAGIDTAGTVAVGGSATGEIELERDRDWFAVELEAGKSYRFDLEGSPTSAGTLYDPYLRGIHDADGDRIAGTSNGDGGTFNNSRVEFTATEDATYYVSAGAYLLQTGTYTLSVEEVI